MHIRVGIFFVMLWASQFSFAQGVSQSPYAQFGYGDLELLANARFQGMGSSGLSLISNNQINLKNPAAAAYNRTNVIFEGGFYGQNTVLNSQSSRQTVLSGNLNYLALLIPISTKNWTIIAGISPYSNANTKFNYQTSLDVPNDTMVKSASFLNYAAYDGGLNQVFLTNAIKLPKGFSIGLTTSMVFGTINRKYESVLNLVKYNPNDVVRIINNNQTDTLATFVDVPTTKTGIKSQEVYRFLDFKIGIGYNKLIKSKYALGIGVTGTFNQCISAERFLINSINSNNLTGNGTGFVLYSDTSLNDKINAKLPSVYALGISYEKLNNWTLAADYTFTDFNNYSSFDQVNVFSKSGHKVSFGAEFIPDYSSLRGYLKKITYRAGGYYTQTPYLLKDTKITDIGGSFGLGLPVGKGGAGMLNIALTVGRRGTTDNSLVQENYFRFFVGVNLNDRWFMRYKVD